eukprot:CAMPEP_0168309238 /NCGR_PEP_ID=MMETSP0142_2-20121227/66171_1 /TAXON_ID=44445 /ORGANISM="Pseudo-nitzschia australis, Strain 10249 10 AB" /LENGTH=600 /DNA_ID=CAMNT_0008261949 /DNA_START=60 /DNA_END=1860 /DNA_ORIENTATION=-
MPNKSYCCFGHQKSKTNTPKNRANNWSCLSQVGILCDRCRCFFCYSCLNKILQKTSQLSKPPIYVELEDALHHKKKTVSMCHSCWFLEKTIKCDDETQNLHTNTKLHHPLCGCFYLPEFGLLIDSPIVNESGKNHVDVHGLGAETGSPQPLHCVLDYDATSTLPIDFSPKTINSMVERSNRFTRRRVILNIPHYVSGSRHLTFSIDLISIKVCPDAVIPPKGTHLIPPHNLDHLVYFGTGDKFPKTSITIIVGTVGNDNKVQSLLLCRFWNAVKSAPSLGVVNQFLLDLMELTENNGIEKHRMGGSSANFSQSSAFTKFLQSNLMELTENNGIEKHRMGGSSANFSQSSAFKKFLQSRGICPRRLKGTCIIPYGNKVTVAYINSEGNAMFFHYSNPVHGGKIKTISMSVLNKYPFLQVFAECKIYTALLLRRLNQMKAFTIVPTAVRCELAVLKECQDKMTLSSNTMDMTISDPECKIYTALLLRRLNQMKAFTIVPTAVRCELAVLKECQDKLNLSKEYNGHDNFRSQLLKEFSLWYSFTVVLHPVGYHQDNFGAKTVSGYDTNSLENKICFRTKGFGKDFYGCGRFGAGESYCCFALL